MATQSGLTEPLLADGDDGGSDSPLHHVDSTQSVCEAVDIPPTPRRQQTRGGPLTTVCPFILATEFCERLAYYGLATNLVNFFSDHMLFEKAAAAATVQSWSGACYATALIGAVVADSALGRFRTILLFSSIYVVGLLLLSCCAGLVPAWSPVDGESPSRLQVSLLFIGLYTVALATGGIKPNVSAFGADQFDSSNPTHVRQKGSFFSWFYMSVNVGSLLASSAVVYIQENVSWKVGFLVPTCAMGAALLFFILGSRRYRHAARPPGAQSPITRALAVVITAALARLDEVLCCRRRVRRTLSSGGGGLGPTSQGVYTPPASPLADAEGAATSPLADSAAGEVPRLQRWLRLATHDYGGKFTELQVEEVAMVVALLPVMCTSVVYWLVYAQMGSVFVQQGAQMDRRLGSILLPSASMTTCDTLAVVLLIPLLDAVIRWRAKTGRPKLMPLQRTGAGHLCAVAAMLTAAALEHFRLDAAWKGRLVSPEDADGATDVVAISILWQAPQYILIGASEVLAAIAQLEFFYSSSPESMRSCAMALQLAANAAGGFLASGLLSSVAIITQRLGTPWFTQDLNDGRLDLFFLLLAALMFVDFLAFTLVASRKVYARATLAQAQASLDRERARVAARAARPPRPPIMRSDPVRVVRDAVTRVTAGGLPQSFSAGSFLGAARGSLVPRTDVPAHLM